MGLLVYKSVVYNLIVLILVYIENGICLQSFGSYNEQNAKANQGQAANQILKQNQNVHEVVQVRFLTKLRSKRSIHESDYHILEIHRINSKMTIHVTKNENLLSSDFTFMVNNGRSKREVDYNPLFEQKNLENLETHFLSKSKDGSDCIYSGVVSGSKNEMTSNLHNVALSACGEHLGFTGLITTNEGTYFLEPTPLNSNENNFNEYSQDSTISHMLAVVNLKEEAAFSCGGVIYANETEKVNMNASSTDVEAEAVTSQPNYHKKGKREKTKSKKMSNRVLELAVFADPAFVEQNMKKLKTKSPKIIRNFILLLVQMMAKYFQSPTMEIKIDVVVVHVELLTKIPASLDTHRGLYLEYLTSFCKFASNLNAGHSKWDHAMMLTGLDLRSEFSNMYLGVAYTGALCTATHSCSLIEAVNFRAPQTMAHELGHSFGMKHDGETENLLCAKDQFIMAAITTPTQHTWSSCSNQNMNKYLNKLENEQVFMSKPDCLKTSIESRKQYSFSSKLPGEKFNPDNQCMVFSPNYTFAVTHTTAHRFVFKEKEPYNICKRLYCTDSTYKYSFNAHAALEGSECGDGKWCRNGDCVTKQ